MSIPVRRGKEVKAERGTILRCKGWRQEAILRLLENNLENAEDPDNLVIYMSIARAARDAALVVIDQSKHQLASRRDELTSSIAADLVGMYERQRGHGGPGAGLLQGRRCGACRIEIDRGEMSRISAAPIDDVLRCPECGAILLRVEDFGK